VVVELFAEAALESETRLIMVKSATSPRDDRRLGHWPLFRGETPISADVSSKRLRFHRFRSIEIFL
jgi:hypothetical protein